MARDLEKLDADFTELKGDIREIKRDVQDNKESTKECKDDVKSLKEKVNSLENKAWLFAALAAALALNGAGLWSNLSDRRKEADDIKKQLADYDEAVKKTLQKATNPEIERAKKAINDEQVRLVTLLQKEVQITNGCIVISTVQTCWGSSKLTPDPANPHTAAFSFKFGQAFADAPTITPTVTVDGAGHMLGVYASKPDAVQYNGRVANYLIRYEGRNAITQPIDGSITMSYIAVGAPKK